MSNSLGDHGSIALARLPLFVYGTLRPGGSNYHVVEQWVRDVQPAAMAGLQLWDLGSYPMACEGMGRIQGDLLTLDEDGYEEAMTRVDDLEGVDRADPARPGRIHYWRERRTAIVPGCGGSQPEAWVYLSAPTYWPNGTRITSGDWLKAKG